jgi:hypothetical protein
MKNCGWAPGLENHRQAQFDPRLVKWVSGAHTAHSGAQAVSLSVNLATARLSDAAVRAVFTCDANGTHQDALILKQSNFATKTWLKGSYGAAEIQRVYANKSAWHATVDWKTPDAWLSQNHACFITAPCHAPTASNRLLRVTQTSWHKHLEFQQCNMKPLIMFWLRSLIALVSVHPGAYHLRHKT